MKPLNDVLLNVVLITFPMLIYFIYNCYRELKCEKYNSLLLNVSLFSSLYLCLKYGQIEYNPQLLIISSIPILIAYLKKEPQVALALSLITIFYTYYTLHLSTILITIKLISYFLIYLISHKKNIKDQTFIIIIAIIQGFFATLEYTFIHPSSNYLTIINLLITTIIFYFIPVILLYLFTLADNITSLYLTQSEFEKEKQLKNSLFKITHEVKNPIAVCKGYLDMLNINNKDQLERYIPIIKQELERSLNIMCDFLEFSKIKVDKEIIDINVLLEDVIEELSLITKSKKIKIISNITKDEIFIKGDYNRLKQVFINIIKNSIESITNTGTINITTHILKEKYYIEIEDNGCGMTEETLSKVKTLFFTTKAKGSGLGVSLSNEIIKAHSGSIDYISKLKKGTKVTVKLPLTTL